MLAVFSHDDHPCVAVIKLEVDLFCTLISYLVGTKSLVFATLSTILSPQDSSEALGPMYGRI